MTLETLMQMSDKNELFHRLSNSLYQHIMKTDADFSVKVDPCS